MEADNQQQDSTAVAIGQELRAAREGKGLSIGEVADRLKLSVKQLNAIERGDFASLPGATFARGFVRSYARYMEMNADALVLGVANPGAVSSSKDKTFAEVATDARKRMDEKYALMKASDKPYTGSDEDRNGLMGDLDRRSLNAVATNEGGLFTAEEQASAQALMRQQGRLATGYYSGPADQQKNWKDPFANDPYGRAKAALDFMNNMSPEEKAKPEWLSQRLSLEAALNQSQGSELDPAKKKTGHFPNLAEILSGAVTQSDEDKDSQSRFGDPSAQIMKTLEARNA